MSDELRAGPTLASRIMDAATAGQSVKGA